MKTFTNLHNLHNYFTSEKKCIEYLEKARWNNEPACLRCGALNPYIIKNHNKKGYRCRECNYIFNVLIGTMFENTKLPLVKWFKAMYLVTSHKKGISSYQLGKDLGFTQKTAWFVLGRIRKLVEEKNTPLFSKVCEADETFIGGKVSNKHVSKRKKIKNSMSPTIKTAVFGMVERNGRIFNQVVPDTYKATLLPIIKQVVKHGCTIYTDSSRSYKDLKLNYEHEAVNHEQNEYVRGLVHTNTIEGYWSLLKRGIIGIYHQVSVKHLHRYCNEFSFRYNTREANEVERFVFAVKKLENTRLKYAEYIKPV